ncbi:MAG: ClbS/DfsB family four-helix bundle protein [Phycisphaeraceae bacterium]|nr:MAG: ClbS/DfsB family four-helix bundle protein [Phycisphaeraceae bacterium]
MRYASKADFVARMESEHDGFLELAESIGKHRFDEPGVWGKGWTIKDLFAHLTAWERMFLGWHREGLAGRRPQMPAPGFKWNELPKLNHSIWKEHKNEAWEAVAEAFDESYEEMEAFVAGLSERDLLEPGRFAWCTRYPLTTYLGANTASHYGAAIRILRRWVRDQARSE